MTKIIAGKYEVIKELGRGAMGTVYKTKHLSLDRYDALKVLHSSQSTDTDFVDRFIREAKSMARLDHPNVIRVYDVFEFEDMHCIAMELFDGFTLHDLQRSGKRLKIKEVIAIITQATKGLAFAHGCHIVHRDIKPSNIMVNRRLQVKIADFGIAAAMDDLSLTQTGELIGSPRYMAPEQARSEKIDHRSDLYSLGMVFYELITGTSPFKGKSSISIIAKLANGSKELDLTFEDAVPEKIQDIIRRLLSRSPINRFADAAALCRELSHLGLSRAEMQTESLASHSNALSGSLANIEFTEHRPDLFGTNKIYTAIAMLIVLGIPLFAFQDSYIPQARAYVYARLPILSGDLKEKTKQLQMLIEEREKGSKQARAILNGIYLDQEARQLYNKTLKVHANGSTELADAKRHITLERYVLAREMLVVAEAFFDAAENQFSLVYELAMENTNESVVKKHIDEVLRLQQQVKNYRKIALKSKADLYSNNELKRGILYQGKADKLFAKAKLLKKNKRLIKTRSTLYSATISYTTASDYFDKANLLAKNEVFAILVESKLIELRNSRLDVNSAKIEAELDGANVSASRLYKKAHDLDQELYTHENEIYDLVDSNNMQEAMDRIKHALTLAQNSQLAYIKAWKQSKSNGEPKSDYFSPQE